jgi:two-component system, NtrC family, sensor kinase
VTDHVVENPQQVIADLKRRLDESIAGQTATADVLKVISRSTFDLQLVLETLITSAIELSGANRGSIFLRDGDVFPLRAASSTTPEFLQYWAANPPRAGRGSATSRVIASGKVELIPDILEDPDMEMSAGSLVRIRAALGVPMLRDKQVEGVLVLTRREPGPFTQSQIDLVQTFADQAMIAIENARLFDEVQAKTADLNESLQHQTATSEVLQVISRSPGELDPVFQTILSSATRICDAQFGLLVLYEDGGFRCTSTFNLPPAFAETFLRNPVIYPPPIDPLGRLIETRKLVHVVDVKLEPAYLTGFPPIMELVELGGARTLLLVPMLKENDLVGVIAIFRQTVHAFSDKQIELVTSFGSQAVIAIENARLLGELHARTDDLSESLQQQTATADVLKVISRSAFDLKSVLTTLTESAKLLCGGSLGIICLRDGEVMRLQAESGCTQAFVDFMHAHPIKPGRETITGRVFTDGKPVHVADVELDAEYRFGNAPAIGAYRAVLAVPLMRDGAVEGVLLLGRPEPGPFSQRQLDLVQTFSDQAVIAIENVRLFDEVQARTSELSLSLEELRTAQDRLVQTEKLASLGQLTAGIAHEIKNPLNFVNNFSALSAELIDELNDLLGSTALDEKTREEVDELTQMLKGNLEKVVQHGKRADSIVKNMLLHSREGSGEHRSADINTIVEESLNLAYHGVRAEKPGFNITLKRDLDPSAGMIDLYPQEITRVFLNLISNGFYAANKRREAGGEGFEPSLTATTKDLGNRVEIRIRDNGAGIPAEVREKMFNPFFTTKPAGEGTGLGLSMSHDIVVKQHGGKIEVDTEPGAFTEFIITLPRAVVQRDAGGRN